MSWKERLDAERGGARKQRKWVAAQKAAQKEARKSISVVKSTKDSDSSSPSEPKKEKTKKDFKDSSEYALDVLKLWDKYELPSVFLPEVSLALKTRLAELSESSE